MLSTCKILICQPGNFSSISIILSVYIFIQLNSQSKIDIIVYFGKIYYLIENRNDEKNTNDSDNYNKIR